MQNIKTDNKFDLILKLPKKYLDCTFIISLKKAKTVDYSAQMRVIVTQVFTNKKLLYAFVRDDSDTGKITYFNFTTFLQNMLVKYCNQKQEIFIFGKFSRDNYNVMTIQQPIIFASQQKSYVAYYGSLHNKQNRVIKNIINQELQHPIITQDYIPKRLLEKYKLYELREALYHIHIPTTTNKADLLRSINIAKKTLLLEEIIAQYFLSLSDSKKTLTQKLPHFRIEINFSMHNFFLKLLPFLLTECQVNAINDIFSDWQANKKVFRLIQGDVGCGKTVVFIAAMLQVHQAKKQSVLLSATSLLAEQHYMTLQKYLKVFNIEIFLIHSKLKYRDKTAIYNKISVGIPCIIVTTTALLSANLLYNNLALVVIDEQHKFGVEQINILTSKVEALRVHSLHYIMLSATPIPRTLLMANYSHLSTSTIKTKPTCRKETKTFVISNTKRELVIKSLKGFLRSGKRAYWVCSRKIDTGNYDSVVEIMNELNDKLPNVKIGMVHGSMSDENKQNSFSRFITGEIQLLVTTTVIEVGIDICDAEMIIIENAERLGLAQLHQLRGRVGRGNTVGYCILIYNETSNNSFKHRLFSFKNCVDGSQIAEIDLQNRGGGNILGEEQSGYGRWKVAKWSDIPKLLPIAIKIANEIDKIDPNLRKMFINRWCSNSNNDN